jgi:hypothetical protein
MSPDDTNPPAGTTPGETLLCMRCRRPLPNLGPQAPCPSCRTPIADSLQFQRLFSTFNFSALIAGSRWLALSGLVTILVLAFSQFSTINNSPQVNNTVFAYCAISTIFLVNYVAIFLGIRRLLAVPQTRPRRAIRILCLANPVLEVALFLCYVLLITINQPSDDHYQWLVAFFILSFAFKFLISFLTYLLALIFMRRTAQRLRRPWLSKLAILTFTVFAFGSLLCLLTALSVVLTFFSPNSETTLGVWRSISRLYDFLLPFGYLSFFAQPILLFVFFLALAFIAQYARNHLPANPPCGIFSDSDPLPPADLVSTVHDNLSCQACSYNLRTLHSARLCPECGTPVQTTLEFNARFSRYRLPCLRAAAYLIILTSALVLAISIPFVWDPTLLTYFNDGTLWFANILTGLVTLQTILLIVCRRRSSHRHYIRACTAFLIIAGIVLVQIHMDMQHTASFDVWFPPWIQSTIQWLLLSFLFAAAHGFMMNFSRETGLKTLETPTHVAFTIAILCALALTARSARAASYYTEGYYDTQMFLFQISTLTALVYMLAYWTFFAILLRRLRPRKI